MLAICSDLDETPDAETYFETCRFLNTREETAVGPGVGIEVGNSIYFDMPRGQFSYRNGNDGDRARVRQLISSGHIDCLHSFGDHADTRDHALRALDDLETHDCRLSVWIDHGTAPTNLGADIMHGHGDEQGHAAYHADRTIAHGIRYVWRGRVTSVLGQNVPFSLRGISRRGHAVESAATVLKEGIKHVLAQCGNRKYAVQRLNHLMTTVQLRDGSTSREFVRCNPHYGGVSSCDEAEGIADVLTSAFLDRLVQRKGVCILYTHLGKLARRNGVPHFSEAAVRALRRLAEQHAGGKTLITTTRRLLDFNRLADETVFRAEERPDGGMEITADPPEDANAGALQGLTFYTATPEHTTLSVGGKRVEGLRIHPPDHTGRASVGIPWEPLEFPSE
jgi:hypothetical protein